MDSLRRSLFGDSLSLYDLWSRPWGVSRILGPHGLPASPIPQKGLGNQQQQQQMVVAFTITEINYSTVSQFFLRDDIPFLYIFVVLSFQFGYAIDLFTCIATKATIVLSIFIFTNCCGYGFILIFSKTFGYITML